MRYTIVAMYRSLKLTICQYVFKTFNKYKSILLFFLSKHIINQFDLQYVCRS